MINKKYCLTIKTEKSLNGYWDGGAKNIFNFEVNNIAQDKKGFYAKIGSWEGNVYFHISAGIKKQQTEKQILKNALKHNILKNFINKYKGIYEIKEVLI